MDSVFMEMEFMVRVSQVFFVALILFTSCKKSDEKEEKLNPYYRQEMRNFVIGISQVAKAENSNFLIIPQNGIELVTMDGEPDGTKAMDYLNAIDANGQEDLLYGYNNDNEATPGEERDYIINFLNVSRISGNKILVTDYCSTPSKMDDSYAANHSRNYVSFAADQRNLDHIPNHPNPIYAENDDDILSISQVKNFLYLINPANFTSKSDFIDAVTATNYDLIIMDLFSADNLTFTSSDIEQLRIKANGGSRLVVCYMSIGEAEDYRYYWNPSWQSDKPEWLDAVNPDWPGNYKVKYWESAWQDIIYGNDDSYLSKILAAGFDGVYLDIIDGFEYYE